LVTYSFIHSPHAFPSKDQTIIVNIISSHHHHLYCKEAIRSKTTAIFIRSKDKVQFRNASNYHFAPCHFCLDGVLFNSKGGWSSSSSSSSGFIAMALVSGSDVQVQNEQESSTTTTTTPPKNY
jgi:hypothetical protein